MLPVGCHVPVAGLYSSALAEPPPATRTRPVFSNVAVAPVRATAALPVADHVFARAAPVPPCTARRAVAADAGAAAATSSTRTVPDISGGVRRPLRALAESAEH